MENNGHTHYVEMLKVSKLYFFIYLSFIVLLS